MTASGRKTLVLATVTALFAQGCATQQSAPPALPDLSQLDQMMEAGKCSPASAALIGAALGAMIADDDRAKGAAVGAGLGALACFAINAQSRQTQTPPEVDRQYRADHQGTLPDQPLVSAYDTAFNARGGAVAGREAQVLSSITLVSGSREPVREVVEVLEVFEAGDPGRLLLRAEKKADPAVLSGGIQNRFTVRLPEGLAPGSYPARAVLYVNGKLAGENRGALRVLGPESAA
jgi:hypothetical protein